MSVEGQSGNEQFGEVALGIDAAEAWLRFLSHEERVDVGTAAEQQGVDTFQRLQNGCFVGERRDDEWRTASTDYLFIISLSELACLLAVVSGNTDNWPPVSSGETLVKGGQSGVKVKTDHLFLFLYEVYGNIALKTLFK